MREKKLLTSFNPCKSQEFGDHVTYCFELSTKPVEKLNFLCSTRTRVQENQYTRVQQVESIWRFFLSCECVMISHGNQSCIEKRKWLMKNTSRLSRLEPIGMYLSYCVCDVQIGMSHGNETSWLLGCLDFIIYRVNDLTPWEDVHVCMAYYVLNTYVEYLFHTKVKRAIQYLHGIKQIRHPALNSSLSSLNNHQNSHRE